MKDLKSKHTSQNRRKFLKKALYATPTLVVLGTLAKPTNLEAGSTIPGPPGGGRGLAPATVGGGLGGAGLVP